jgi:hypothetical protein
MVQPNGVAATYWFEYGTRAAKLVQTQLQTLTPTTADTKVSAQLTGLTPHTVYYFRVAAQNGGGTSRGQILEFRSGGQAKTSDSSEDSSSDLEMSQTTTSTPTSVSPPAASLKNTNAGTIATVGTQTATLEVVTGRNTPLVVGLAEISMGTPVNAICVDLPQGATCSYDDKNQSVTITPATSTPPGRYQVGISVTAVPEPQ